jgi:hypothetical protein
VFDHRACGVAALAITAPIKGGAMPVRPMHRAPSTGPAAAAEVSAGLSVLPFVPVDHQLRVELGPRVAGLVLGAVIQGGPRRRANGRIPPPRRRHATPRPVAPVSLVAIGLPPALRRDRVVVLHVPTPERVERPLKDDQPLERWENEGGRISSAVDDRPTRRGRGDAGRRGGS